MCIWLKLLLKEWKVVLLVQMLWWICDSTCLHRTSTLLLFCYFIPYALFPQLNILPALHRTNSCMVFRHPRLAAFSLFSTPNEKKIVHCTCSSLYLFIHKGSSQPTYTLHKSLVTHSTTLGLAFKYWWSKRFCRNKRRERE